MKNGAGTKGTEQNLAPAALRKPRGSGVWILSLPESPLGWSSAEFQVLAEAGDGINPRPGISALPYLGRQRKPRSIPLIIYLCAHHKSWNNEAGKQKLLG